MDRRLKRELEAIGRDRTSGAAELALRAIRGVEMWLRSERKLEGDDLSRAAKAVAYAQPSMAPMLRLANELALCGERGGSSKELSQSLRVLRDSLENGPIKIARLLGYRLKQLHEPEVFTYSHSSTVVTALKAVRKMIWGVHCSESRPGNEGKRTATELSGAGIRVVFETDAGLMSQLHGQAIVLLGVDAVMPGFVASKTGSRALARLSRRLGAQLIWICDTSKFIPKGLPWSGTWGPDSELWKKSPRNVSVYNLYFELTQFSKEMRFLTERGWMTAPRVRRELNRLPVSTALWQFFERPGNSRRFTVSKEGR